MKLPRVICPWCKKNVSAKWVGDGFYLRIREHRANGESCTGSYHDLSFENEIEPATDNHEKEQQK